MKFDDRKKNSIMRYILEKADSGTPGLSKCVAEAFGISQNTAHAYINELTERNVIIKKGRGKYELKKQKFVYLLEKNNGDFASDTYAYDRYLKNHINGFADNVKRIWNYSLSEMINNVIDHSEAESAVMTVEQDHLKTSVAIIDDGIGIFEKIKNYFGFSDTDEAICELFKGKLTTDERNHSGEGIFFTSKMMDEFYIKSDNKMFAVNKYDTDTKITEEKDISSGTYVFMSLSNFTKKETYEIFDLYSSQDGGFCKTRIPLKNIFDQAPVSRSQAKRICSRLDEFKEVILDFDGLEWMGQGFAHQIFVVYKNGHPETEILPVNMCKNVKSMYDHVQMGN